LHGSLRESGSVFFESVEPTVNFVAKRRYGDSGEAVGTGFETAQGGVHQACGSLGIVALEMMKGSGYLNEGLQECLLRLGGNSPHIFPTLVGLEILSGFIEAKTFGEIRLGPIQVHENRVHRGAYLIPGRSGRVVDCEATLFVGEDRESIAVEVPSSGTGDFSGAGVLRCAQEDMRIKSKEQEQGAGK
jgi:hypothetical protein